MCDKVDEYTFSNYEAEYRITDVELMATCLDHPILINYGKGNPLYGLHISQLKIYDEPKELSDFWTIKYANKKGGCSDCDIKPGCIKHITRPPQSWCYVEEQDDDKE